MTRPPRPPIDPAGPPAAPKGLPEAERQLRVAERLYAESGATRPWARLQVQDRRPWVDRACDPAHRDLTG